MDSVVRRERCVRAVWQAQHPEVLRMRARALREPVSDDIALQPVDERLALQRAGWANRLWYAFERSLDALAHAQVDADGLAFLERNIVSELHDHVRHGVAVTVRSSQELESPQAASYGDCRHRHGPHRAMTAQQD